jgi:D-glycero-alpha-D-manno-heptose-7-phosphate kinase
MWGNTFSRVPDLIVTRAPTRIDFGGGWTDVPPYSDEQGGFVCNVAISRYATVRVHAVPDSTNAPTGSGHPSADRSIVDAAARRLGVSGVAIDLHSDFPVGAGLGGSSAASVAAISALSTLRDESLDPMALAELSRDVEVEDLGIAGGRQDHYAAVFGGALGLRFSSTGTTVTRIPLAADFRAQLERSCLVIYTGQSRISGDTINAVIDAYRDREPRVLFALQRMRDLAEQMASAVAEADSGLLAGLVGEQWAHQRALHPAIPTPLIDEVVARAQRAGASGAKALGASGGGCVLVIARDDRVAAVRSAVEPLGELVPFSISTRGVERCE